jgi:hypothetical protein
MKIRFLISVLAVGLGALGLSSPKAAAQEEIPTPEVDRLVSGGSLVDPGLDRPYLFMTDPSLPAPGHVIVSAGLGSITRSGEERPVGAGSLLPTLSAEVGVISHLSLYAEGEVAYDAPGQTTQTNFGLEVGAHILLTDPRSQNVRVALQANFGRDFSGWSRVGLNATAAWDIERLRLAGSITGAHVFAEEADSIDLTGVFAVSYLLPFDLRLGGELIGQDLEETWSSQAEGGASAFAGPTLGWELLHRFEIVLGPMFGLTTGASQVVARGAASVLF